MAKKDKDKKPPVGEVVNALQFQDKRVGSTFLQQAIDSHKDINGYDEVFVNVAKKPGMKKSGFVPYVKLRGRMSVDHYIREKIWKEKKDDGKEKKNKKNTIFKVMYNQINHHNGLWQFVIKEKMPVIHVKRKNILKQVISKATAAREIHEKLEGATPELLFQKVKELDILRESWSSKLRENGLRVLDLWYEDVIGETIKNRTYVDPKVNKLICNFFGVDNEPLYAKTKKKNKDDVWVYIPNRGAVLKRFKDTKYEWMVL